ncbi:uncharacterized protein LOC125189310 [Salvia hispanica]|uniref:uncharacterized protein LOC125189310 n=1 Tax=Salvia hispanica TaxID=49212 RepID=UPI0020094A7A|nr:uncharacterized protein LOC125189310 [Salvia hispanica]
MNPDDYDLSTSDACRRALTQAFFDAVNEAAAECLAQMQREQAVAEEVAAAVARVPCSIRRRTYVPREQDVAHERLFADYFSENSRWGPNVFRRRFRMSRNLFLRIVHTLEGRDEYFQYREDGIGRHRSYAIAEVHGCDPPVGLRHNNGYVLRVPSRRGDKAAANVSRTFLHVFLGMLGNIDCMHRQWKNRPTAWRGQFTSGYKGSPYDDPGSRR